MLTGRSMESESPRLRRYALLKARSHKRPDVQLIGRLYSDCFGGFADGSLGRQFESVNWDWPHK